MLHRLIDTWFGLSAVWRAAIYIVMAVLFYLWKGSDGLIIVFVLILILTGLGIAAQRSAGNR